MTDPAVEAFRDAVLLRDRWRCQAGARIIAVDVDAGRRCKGVATMAHHLVVRGMGGHGDHSPENGIAVCAWCHDWIHRNPDDAYTLDILRRRVHTPLG